MERKGHGSGPRPLLVSLGNGGFVFLLQSLLTYIKQKRKRKLQGRRKASRFELYVNMAHLSHLQTQNVMNQQ
jgi:hypothetical protein